MTTQIPRPTVTRFAPSPNGRLHIGHAFAAIIAHDIANNDPDGQFLLRIEDIDGPRSRPEFADEFRRDLEWLGLEWIEVEQQSKRIESYQRAIEALQQQETIYPCACTRAEIEALPKRQTEDRRSYPGSCKGQCVARVSSAEIPVAWRLDIDRAMSEVGEIVWTDEFAGSITADPREFGDVVLVRKDLPASYHLAVTLDDAADGVTLVTRGQDLYDTTAIHRILQELLGLSVPHWLHHKLLLDETGEKLAKRRGSPPLAERRLRGDDGLMLAEQLRLQKIATGT